MSELCDEVLRLARALPAGQRTRVVAALAASNGPDGTARRRLLAVSAAPDFAWRVGDLLAAWRAAPAVTPAGLALALEAAGAAGDADRAREVRPVWTGPDAGDPVRLTAAVVAELVTGARERLLVLSFAAYKIPRVLSALEDAARRGVQVDVVLETAEDSSGALRFDQLPAFTGLERVRVWHWPAERRPPEGGNLHAKAIVADGEVALVTSANLTGHALAHNIELGLLVRDVEAVRAIEAHVAGLQRSGVLARIPSRAS